MSAFGGPEINDSNLLLLLDASNPKSYPGSGATWTSLANQGGNGTLINSPVFSFSNNGTITFNGTSQYVDCGNVSAISSLTTNFSVEAWVKWTGPVATSGNGQWILANVDVSSTNGGFQLGYIFNNGFIFSTYGNLQDARSNTTATINTWYHLVGVKSSSSGYTLYVNGVVAGTNAAITASGAATRNLRIGHRERDGGSAGYFPGTIPIVKIYNSALSAYEVSQIYNASRERFSTPAEVKAGLILDLDAGNTSSYSGSGTTWSDLSGSGYNVTLYNGPIFNSGNGGSIVFDGSNDYAQTANLTSVVSEKTLAAWCQLGSTTQSGGGLIGVMSTDGSIFDTIVYNETGQGWGFGSNNFFRTAWSGVSESSTSAWVYLAATYSNNLYKLYRNGVLILTTTAYSLYTFNIGINFIVGKRHSTVTGPLNAKIAKATVYNRALSALEIGTNFDALRGRYGL